MAGNVVDANRVGAGLRWLRRWPVVAAVAVGLSLLLAYQAVVRGIVLEGQSRRAGVAALAQDEWHCRTLADRSLRAACLVQIGVPERGASLPAPRP